MVGPDPLDVDWRWTPDRSAIVARVILRPNATEQTLDAFKKTMLEILREGPPPADAPGRN